VITPPDIFSQFMLAGPLYFLYEVSIVVVKFTGKKRPVEESSEVEE
jgi:sec-independent protein translocase protein TatC